MTKPRTLIVSNDGTFRYLLAGYVQALYPCVDLIGGAATPAEALLALRDRQPDLVLLDLCLRPGNALRLVTRMRYLSPAAVVVIGNLPWAEYREAAIAAGARDYVDVYELGMTLPAALEREPKLVDCREPQPLTGEWMLLEQTPFEAPREMATRLSEAPAEQKQSPFTAWQYVHLMLALVLGATMLALRHAPDPGWRLVVLLCILVVAALEARQLAMSHRAAAAPEYR